MKIGIAVLNDNDFQLVSTFDVAFGLLDDNPEPIQPVLGIITLNNAFDASNEDGMINITSWPVFGMYQLDAIATFETNSQTYIISANEGDSRDYDGFSEETTVGEVELDPEAFPNAEALQALSACCTDSPSVSVNSPEIAPSVASSPSPSAIASS